MSPEETWDFLSSGTQYYKDDSYFHDLKGSQPGVGEPAIGYRVVYKKGDKVVSPLIDQPGLLTPSQIEQNAERWGADISEVQHTDMQRRPANLDDGPSIGYYYFPDKDQAIEYMKAIAAGAKKTFNNTPIGWDASGADVDLALMRVTGTASAKPYDEGAVMNDMKYDQEPLLTLNAKDVETVNQIMERQNRNMNMKEFTSWWSGEWDKLELLRQMGTLTDEQKDWYIRNRER